MGGGKSSTQANQQTTNVQDIDTTTIGLEDVEFGVAGVGGNVAITQVQTDQGAVDAAFGFGRDVLSDGLEASLDFGTDAIRESLDFGGDALDFADTSNARAFDFGSAALDLAESATDKSLEFGESAIDSVGQAYDGALDRSLDFGETSVDAVSDAFTRILDFGAAAVDAGNEAQGKALSALGTGITQVSDASRSDTTDAFRRIILYVSIAGAIAAVAYFAIRKG